MVVRGDAHTGCEGGVGEGSAESIVDQSTIRVNERVGCSRLLLQVKERSRRGSSMSARESIVSLNRVASALLKPGVFLSVVDQVRL